MSWFAWVLWLSPAVVLPQPVPTMYWSDVTTRAEFAQSALAPLRRDLAELRPAMRDLDQSVHLKVGAAGGVSPVAFMREGQRHIDIPDIFLAQTINLARISAAMEMPGQISCVADYKFWMETRGRIDIPEAYLAQLSPRENCAALSKRFPLSPVLEFNVETAVASMLMFTYLHELGHLFHRHALPAPTHANSNGFNTCRALKVFELMRSLEYEADRFAVDAMFETKRGELVRLTSSFWTLPSAGTGRHAGQLDAFAVEKVSFHPVALYRWEQILLRYRELAKKAGSLDPKLSALIDEMAAVAQKFRNQLPPLDPDAGACR